MAIAWMIQGRRSSGTRLSTRVQGSWFCVGIRVKVRSRLAEVRIEVREKMTR